MRILRKAMLAMMAMTIVAGAVQAAEPPPPTAMLLKTTADHSKFKELQKSFQSGPEVTKACLGCHTEASKQIHQTQHWKWEYINPAANQKNWASGIWSIISAPLSHPTTSPVRAAISATD